jgi:hypothetical protein
MAALSKDQVASYLRQAGFPEEKIPLMVNIAARESGFNPRAHNPNASTGDNSYGLFQINMLGAMGPERRRRLGLSSNEDLFDPLTNAKAAKAIYESQGINAWTTAKAAMGDPAPKLTPGLSVPTPGLSESSSGLDPIESMMSAILGDTLSSVSRRAREPGRKAFSPEFQSEWSEVGDPLSRGVEAQVAAIEALLPGGGKQQIDVSMPSSRGSLEAPSLGGGELGIVDLGRKLQRLGLKVAEHPEFGGVGKHSPNSHHYAGNALDLTIQPGSPLLAGRPDSDWRALTGQIGSKLKAALPGAEIFHPGDDPVGGHDSHIHLALPGGRITPTQQLMSLFTG